MCTIYAPQDILQPALQQAAQPGRPVSFKTIEAAIYQSYAQVPARLPTCESAVLSCLPQHGHACLRDVLPCWLLLAVSYMRLSISSAI